MPDFVEHPQAAISVMTESDEYDIHPLDRDYSSDAKPNKAKQKSPITRSLDYDPSIRRNGTRILVAGLVVVFLSAIAVSNMRYNPSAERIASLINKLGMVTMLIGGFTIVVAYRLDAIKAIPIGGSRKRFQTDEPMRISFWFFAGCVVAAYALFMILIWMFPYWYNRQYSGIFTCCFTSALVGVMITMIVWHRDFRRAFGIGVLAGLVSNFLFSMSWISIGGGFDFQYAYMIVLGASFFGGLVCAGYVAILGHERDQIDQEAKRRVDESFANPRDSSSVW